MTDIDSEIVEASRRAKTYWEIDGLPVMLVGASTILIGLLLYFATFQSAWFLPALAVFFLLWSVLNKKETLEKLKARITYPRTGYVAPPLAYEQAEYLSTIPLSESEIGEGQVDRRRAAISRVTVVPLGIVLWIATLLLGNRWPACAACVVGAVDLWWKSSKNPPWINILLFLVQGAAMAVFSVPRGVGIALGLNGVTLMVRGAGMFFCYLRQHPAPQA
jgi:TRAP-type uncharacterized transport system fused permease subunit